MLRFSFGIMMIVVVLAAGTSSADVITDWNEHTLNVIRTDLTPPPRASRALAMVHVAIYDAVNGIDPTYRSYLVAPAAPESASAAAAAVAAAHTVLSTLFPAHGAEFDLAREASLANIGDGAAKDDGVEWGETVAAAIIAARANDGSTLIVPYTPGTEPGDWRPTPPATLPAAFPQWPYVTPFALTSGAQFQPDGPPAISSAEYTTAFNEVKEVGSVTSTTRTAEQSEIARFWVNGPGTATPPGHWNSIAQLVAQERGNTLTENARLFALLNIAMADAAIVSWDCKYAFNNWRPVTAIRAADSDGNDQTEIDPEWTPFIPTPPFPDYTSGHSTFSAAGSKVLEHFFGTDDISFEINSDALPDTFRMFNSFSEAADESGQSRIYGGIHWQFSNRDGLSTGRSVGDYVSTNLLKPLPTDAPPTRLCGALNIGTLAVMMLFSALRFRARRR